ncbi:hypothetical protein ACEPPN_003775 [Leptodophora sp. 'Broadleaf-Isolate-01']
MSCKHLMVGATFVKIQISDEHTDIAIPNGIQQIGTETIVHKQAKKIATTYASNQPKFGLRRNTVLDRYRDLHSSLPSKPSHHGQGHFSGFYMHKGDRADANEQALRINLKKWALTLVGTTCADLYRYAVQMKAGEEEPILDRVQIFANLDSFPMSSIVNRIPAIDWLDLPASPDFGKITSVRRAGLRAGTNNAEGDDDSDDILDHAENMEDR